MTPVRILTFAITCFAVQMSLAASRLIVSPNRGYQAQIYSDGKVEIKNLATGHRRVLESNLDNIDDGYFNGNDLVLVSGDTFVRMGVLPGLWNPSTRTWGEPAPTGVIQQRDGSFVFRPISPWNPPKPSPPGRN